MIDLISGKNQDNMLYKIQHLLENNPWTTASLNKKKTYLEALHNVQYCKQAHFGQTLESDSLMAPALPGLDGQLK